MDEIPTFKDGDDLDKALAALENPVEEIVEKVVEPVVEETTAEIVTDPVVEEEKVDEVDELTERENRIKVQFIEARKAKHEALQEQRNLDIARGKIVLTNDEQVEHNAQLLAKQYASQQVQAEKENKIADAARKEYKDFDKVVQSIEVLPGWVGFPPAITVAVMEVVDSGVEHKVLYWLGTNQDEMERIMELSPSKAAIEINKIATKLTTPKAVSKVPAPTKPIVGNSETPKDYVKNFWEQEEKARKAKFK